MLLRRKFASHARPDQFLVGLESVDRSGSGNVIRVARIKEAALRTGTRGGKGKEAIGL